MYDGGPPTGRARSGVRGVGDGGQALLAAVLVVGVLVVVALVVGRVAEAAVARAGAQAAADAVALAGASAGREEAVRVAAANDAIIARYELRGSTVVVTVELRGAAATAAAEAVPFAPRRHAADARTVVWPAG